jgi:hypothetical protein
VSRLLKLTTPYLRAADRLGVVPGSARGRAVGRILAAISGDPILPAPGDVRTLRPPTHEAFVRRVPERNLWVWYTLKDDAVFVVGLTSEPPIPYDD